MTGPTSANSPITRGKILAQIRKAVGNQKKRGILSEEIENLIAVRRGVGVYLKPEPDGSVDPSKRPHFR
ncbi:MAG: hypothetical protein MPW15_26290 [Candidatus Manganitrophus sp.]|nr:hypothetical protein [Candidatus Manganitrophus sp.]